MLHNAAGNAVMQRWYDMSERFPHIQLHESVVKPNHFHAIIEIVGHQTEYPIEASFMGAQMANIQNSELVNETIRAPTRDAPTGCHITVGHIIGIFKSLTTNAYIRGVKDENWLPFKKYVWQLNYYEHIIRNETAHLNIIEYIQTNPECWLDDIYFL